ncbi:Signal peptidase complex subunit 1 [Linum perenne]
MDWQGQKAAEQLMLLLLFSFAAMAFLTGYIMGSFHTMFLIYGGGLLLTALIALPNWPFFNRHPLRWLDPPSAAAAADFKKTD